MQTNVSVIIPTLTFADAFSKDDVYYHENNRYQVLYLLHGFSGDDEDYIKFSNIVRYAEERKLAVVMPSGYNSQYTDSEGGSQYYRYITEELPLAIEAIFPVAKGRENTFIGGLSMGAHGAMKCSVMYPERYSGVLLMSGAIQDSRNMKMHTDRVELDHGIAGMNPLIVKDGAVNDPWRIAKENSEKNIQLPEFWIACGKNDAVLNNCIYASRFLEENGYLVNSFWTEGFAHEWDYWDRVLKKAIYEWLPLQGTPITY